MTNELFTSMLEIPVVEQLNSYLSRHLIFKSEDILSRYLAERRFEEALDHLYATTNSRTSAQSIIVYAEIYKDDVQYFQPRPNHTNTSDIQDQVMEFVEWSRNHGPAAVLSDSEYRYRRDTYALLSKYYETPFRSARFHRWFSGDPKFDIVPIAKASAVRGDVEAVEILLKRHASEVLPYVCDIVNEFSPCVVPSRSIVPLLPCPTDMDEDDDANICDEDKVYDRESIAAWFCDRADYVERMSGDLLDAFELVSLGIEALSLQSPSTSSSSATQEFVVGRNAERLLKCHARLHEKVQSVYYYDEPTNNRGIVNMIVEPEQTGSGEQKQLLPSLTNINVNINSQTSASRIGSIVVNNVSFDEDEDCESEGHEGEMCESTSTTSRDYAPSLDETLAGRDSESCYIDDEVVEIETNLDDQVENLLRAFNSVHDDMDDTDNDDDNDDEDDEDMRMVTEPCVSFDSVNEDMAENILLNSSMLGAICSPVQSPIKMIPHSPFISRNLYSPHREEQTKDDSVVLIEGKSLLEQMSKLKDAVSITMESRKSGNMGHDSCNSINNMEAGTAVENQADMISALNRRIQELGCRLKMSEAESTLSLEETIKNLNEERRHSVLQAREEAMKEAESLLGMRMMQSEMEIATLEMNLQWMTEAKLEADKELAHKKDRARRYERKFSDLQNSVSNSKVELSIVKAISNNRQKKCELFERDNNFLRREVKELRAALKSQNEAIRKESSRIYHETQLDSPVSFGAALI